MEQLNMVLIFSTLMLSMLFGYTFEEPAADPSLSTELAASLTTAFLISMTITTLLFASIIYICVHEYVYINCLTEFDDIVWSGARSPLGALSSQPSSPPRSSPQPSFP